MLDQQALQRNVSVCSAQAMDAVRALASGATVEAAAAVSQLHAKTVTQLRGKHWHMIKPGLLVILATIQPDIRPKVASICAWDWDDMTISDGCGYSLTDDISGRYPPSVIAQALQTLGYDQRTAERRSEPPEAISADIGLRTGSHRITEGIRDRDRKTTCDRLDGGIHAKVNAGFQQFLTRRSLTERELEITVMTG
jgi:hypothetical protein